MLKQNCEPPRPLTAGGAMYGHVSLRRDDSRTSRPGIFRRAWITGSAASICSTALVVLRSRRDGGNLFCGTNATSHWLWGDKALQQSGPSAKYTLAGYLIHHLCAVYWGVVFEFWQELTAARSPSRKILRAAVPRAMAVASLAGAVDYTVTPKRLTPGFEHHLSRWSLMLVYLAFGAGLACTSCCLPRPSTMRPGDDHGA